ncbi:hypothetical protein AVANI_12 [Mycobacterium phage Avani]|uniref:Uncharacterized protein n=6 Tax=Avanivirus TaxID=2843352 RepID=A0A2D1GA56_9CAUD|nr:neck protein [Mycobacterium phage Che9d]YP_008410684.1 neck protein [Mycobacterium phage Jabbawokkie]YP_009013107.1 neck protein [Mycobacterium phage Avani]YP_009613916.1 neck protein [Mycobacterium phage Yoshi]YP_009963710.1 neck protein [Mycobacterium phage Demsculpinboyz]YP_009963827.1 neck protein [Mycobacterium phage Soul22]YP_009963930.1 neck protein [Mycobacterium phage Zapner]QXG07401.1 head to tail connector protein [Mycobacterium phage RitSun]AAN07930.1 hypothetical protein PBI
MTIRVKHKIGGYYKLRSAGGVVAFEEAAAKDVAARANKQLKGKGGIGFAVSSRQGARRPQGRWRTSVAAVSPYARRHNAKHNTLIRALSG